MPELARLEIEVESASPEIFELELTTASLEEQQQRQEEG
jgi:hypothetical protein